MAELSPECQKLFVKYKHPYTCCKYPLRKILESDLENCSSKCLEKSENADCCIIDCNYREPGVLVNGVFNDQALLGLYENFLEENGAGKYDQWMSVVEKSIQKCEKISENFSNLVDNKFIHFCLS